MQIVRVDASGKRIAAVGAKGSGPGEFRNISWFGFGANDSAYVWDGTQRRVSVFGPDATFVRTEAVEKDIPNPQMFGRLRDGRWLVVSVEVLSPTADPLRTAFTVLLYDNLHSVPQRRATYPGKLFARLEVRPGMRIPMGLFLEPSVGFVGCDNGYVVWDGGGHTVRAYSPDGKMLREVHANLEHQVMSAEERASAIAAFKVGPEQVQAANRELIDKYTPAKVPVARTFQIAADGRILLAPVDSTMPWRIVGNDGAARDAMWLPIGFAANQVNSEAVVGLSFVDGVSVVERFLLPDKFRTRASVANVLHPSLGRCEAGLMP